MTADPTDPTSAASEIEALGAANVAKLHELMALGARPDPSSVLMARLEVALSVLFEDSPELAERFALRYEQAMSESLDAMLLNVRKQRLMAPPSSPLIVPGRG